MKVIAFDSDMFIKESLDSLDHDELRQLAYTIQAMGFSHAQILSPEVYQELHNSGEIEAETYIYFVD